MPRTKRPVSKKEKPVEDNEALKKLDRIVADEMNKLDMSAQMQCRDIELAFKILISSLSPSVLQKTVGELKYELVLKEVSHTNTSRSASQDDGYLTENSSHGSGERGKRMGPPSTATKTSSRRSRSVSASTRKPAAPTTVQRRRSRSVYKTPAYNKSTVQNYPPITPKVAPQTPLTVMRQPRQGEMVVSMSGSPVMVQNYNNLPSSSSERANCNIMLGDGTVLSLQPKQLRQSQAFIPFSLMDEGVLHQLKTLKDNLDKVVKMGEKAIK